MPVLGNKSAHLTLHFVVNMAFYQLLHTNSPNGVANVKPNMQKWPHTFQVRFFKPPSQPLDKPTDLPEMIDCVEDRGQKEPSHESSSWNPPQVIPYFYTFVMTIISTILVICVSAGILFLLFKHFELQTLVSTIGLAPVAKVDAKPICVKKVVCSNPHLTVVATIVTIVGSLIWLYIPCRHLTLFLWIKIKQNLCPVHFFQCPHLCSC